MIRSETEKDGEEGGGQARRQNAELQSEHSPNTNKSRSLLGQLSSSWQDKKHFTSSYPILSFFFQKEKLINQECNAKNTKNKKLLFYSLKKLIANKMFSIDVEKERKYKIWS